MPEPKTAAKSPQPARPVAEKVGFAERISSAIIRRGRDIIDRSLHSSRRSSAHKRLSGMQRPRKVLVVCRGNIYRSPYAAQMLRGSLGSASRTPTHIESAGFIGPGRPVPENAVRKAASRGIDLSTHASALLNTRLVSGASLVVVMDARQAQEVCEQFACPPERVIILGDLDPMPIVTREITDPWDESEAVLEGSYARIERCVRELAAILIGLPTSRR